MTLKLHQPDPEDDRPNDFDVDGAVIKFREAYASWERAITNEAKATQLAILNRLREQWKVWSGADDLYETAIDFPRINEE